MTNDELYIVMRQVALIATGCPTVIKSNPNATAPKGEYCAVSVTQPKRQRGQAIQVNSNTDAVTSPIGDVYNVNHQIRPQIIAEVSFNFYRGNAHDYALELFQANKRPDIHQLLYANNLGWNGANAINNLNALQSESWEDRAQLTVRVMYEKPVDIETNAIYQIPVSVEDENENIIESATIVIPNP